MLYSVQFNRENKALKNVSKLSFDSLINKMSEKQIVKVVSCYYGIETLNTFLKKMVGRGRTTDVILCATGVSKESWISQIEPLLDEQNGLKLGQRQNVYLYTRFPLLHSKIYFSKNSCHKGNACGANCLIGSANLSENAFFGNEEILVEVKEDDTRQAIEDYIDNLLLKEKKYLYSIKDLISKKKKQKGKFNLRKILAFPDTSYTLLNYILSGSLFFKAPRNFSLGFGDDEWRKDIKNTSNSDYIKDSKSLDVAAILGVKGLDEIDEHMESSEKDDNKLHKKSKVSIAANSIETCFGYWVPSSKREILLKQIFGNNKNHSYQEQQFNRIFKALSDNCNQAKPEVKEKLKAAFSAVNLEKEKYDVYLNKIIKHIQSKKKYYEKNKAIYLKKGFCITPMPNIFEDTVSSTEFLDSLWDSICVKSNCQEAKGKKDPLAKILYALFVDSEGKMLKLSNEVNKLSF